MGIISLEKQDHLFWLGRYCERVFTTIQTFLIGYDKMLDDEVTTYKTICQVLDIPDVYGDPDTFIKNYLYSPEDPNSIYSNLKHAYDNAVVLRDEISSASLCYIQMALDAMEKHGKGTFSLLNLQEILDILFAFWGSIDDMILSENTRNVLKAGRYLERLDLYIRLSYPQTSISREFEKFNFRMNHLTPMQYNAEKFKAVSLAISNNWPLKGKLDDLNAIFTGKEQ